MSIEGRLHAGRVLLTARRYRRILIASAATLLISIVLLGLICIIRWRGQQAMQNDTTAIIQQTSDQLIRALQSRRGTLTLLRDTLNRQADLTLEQQQALGTSAVEHTRHLLGTALVHASELPVWWLEPKGFSKSELAQLTRAIAKRTQTSGVWRVPSTFVTTVGKERPLLVMLEPLRAPSYRQSAILGVYDLKTFLEDFFASYLPPRYPVQLLSEETLLYRSSSWQPLAKDQPPILEERNVTVDATRWTMQMQPGRTNIMQTLSWFNVLLVGLSVIAGCGVTIIIWIFAARAWILQRAVTRRTAALRRVTARLRQMAITDELTGLYNRRFFLNRWDWECERAKRYQRPLACLMIDVNGFKQVNDHLGHHAGDLVLKRVAQELKTMLRQSDILARFGGDEFVIALPETDHAKAASVAEKLRQLRLHIPEGITRGVLPVSLSVGISEIEQDNTSAQGILEAADQSLYQHKRHRMTSIVSR